MDATLHATQHTTTAPHPWEVEPDYARWRDPATGLMCCIVRNEHCGYLQGYVAMPKHHRLAKASIAPARWEGYSRDTAAYMRLEWLFHDYTHGGVTWYDALPKKGRWRKDGRLTARTRARWLGFDCGHLLDYAPFAKELSFLFLASTPPEAYRDWAYVKGMVEQLARAIRTRR